MLKERSKEHEDIDDLSISGFVIDQTLKELSIINKRLGGNRISISAYIKLAGNRKNLTLADLGCGGGNMMVQMAKWSRKKNLKTKFIGIDANSYVIQYAKSSTKTYPEIIYQPINIFSKQFESRTFDIIHSCLFLHHFTSEQLVKLLKQFKKQAKVGVIINDLHRHPFAYWGIKIYTTLFSKSLMVKNDASVSVTRGFLKSELVEIMEKAGIEKYELHWKWAFRWKLVFITLSPKSSHHNQ